jgi:hypothetical protein
MGYNLILQDAELAPGITVNAYNETGYGRGESWRERTKKSRLYVSPKGEGLMANFVNRHHRPNVEWAKLVRAEVLPILGIPTKGMRWNVHAGCGMCPCSPGFILPGWFAPTNLDAPLEGFADVGHATPSACHFHVTVDYDIIEGSATKLAPLDAAVRAEIVGDMIANGGIVIPAELVKAP